MSMRIVIDTNVLISNLLLILKYAATLMIINFLNAQKILTLYTLSAEIRISS